MATRAESNRVELGKATLTDWLKVSSLSVLCATDTSIVVGSRFLCPSFTPIIDICLVLVRLAVTCKQPYLLFSHTFEFLGGMTVASGHKFHINRLQLSLPSFRCLCNWANGNPLQWNRDTTEPFSYTVVWWCYAKVTLLCRFSCQIHFSSLTKANVIATFDGRYVEGFWSPNRPW